MNNEHNYEYDNSWIDTSAGQKREFVESGRIFTVKEKKYPDRDIWICVFEDGTEEDHNGFVIAARSSVIIEKEEEMGER